MSIKEFIVYFGVIIGLANTLLMLFLFSRIWEFGSTNVNVLEPNTPILILEVILCI